MKKFIIISSIFLSLIFTSGIITAAETKQFSQGFYTMKDLGLNPNIVYKVRNNEPYVEGLVIIIGPEEKIQQIIRILPGPNESTLIPLKYDYKFIIYNDVRLTFY